MGGRPGVPATNGPSRPDDGADGGIGTRADAIGERLEDDGPPGFSGDAREQARDFVDLERADGVVHGAKEGVIGDGVGVGGNLGKVGNMVVIL